MALSVLIVFGIQFKSEYCSNNLTAVCPSVITEAKLVAAHLLKLFIESFFKKTLVQFDDCIDEVVGFLRLVYSAVVILFCRT